MSELHIVYVVSIYYKVILLQEARMGVDAYAKRKKTNDQLSHADFLTRIVMVATKAFNKPAVGSIQEGVTAVTASGIEVFLSSQLGVFVVK